MTNPVHLDVAEGIATILLDRPQVGNAIDADMAQALLDTVTRCDNDPAVRCVILTGAGKMFCAGGDVQAFATAGDGVRELIEAITTPLHDAIVRLIRMPKPIVSMINGAAAGAGLGLALLGDISVAAQSAKFSAGYGGLGFTPDAGVSWLLPKLVGLRRAQQILLGGERIDARDAERIGLVTLTVDDAELKDVTILLASRMMLQSGDALMKTRCLMYRGYHTDLSGHLANEATFIGITSQSKDGREGIRAFVDKRKPIF